MPHLNDLLLELTNYPINQLTIVSKDEKLFFDKFGDFLKMPVEIILPQISINHTFNYDLFQIVNERIEITMKEALQESRVVITINSLITDIIIDNDESKNILKQMIVKFPYYFISKHSKL